MALLGAYGMSVLTALTAQNTKKVRGIHEVPAQFVELQIDTVLSDMGADAVKTGMLVNGQIVSAVARKLREHAIETLVVDPVMAAKSGDLLLNDDGRKALKRELLPLAYLVTPNLPEAEVLCERRVSNLAEMREAAQLMVAMGARHALIKGGHLRDKAIDLLYDGKEFFEFHEERVNTKNTHGTGCVLSAAIVTFLAQRYTLREAVSKAKGFVTDAIRFGMNLGKGNGPCNIYAAVGREMEAVKVVRELKTAVERLGGKSIGGLIPEVQANLVYALSHATTLDEVFAFPGRIIRFRDEIRTLAEPEAGASRHMGSVILTTMQSHPDYRSAMNIRFDPAIVRKCRKLGLKAVSFSREDEPGPVRRKEGASLEWGVTSVLKGKKLMPDIIYDYGGVGKEPMIRVMGRTPLEVADKIIRIAG